MPRGSLLCHLPRFHPLAEMDEGEQEANYAIFLTAAELLARSAAIVSFFRLFPSDRPYLVNQLAVRIEEGSGNNLALVRIAIA